MNKDIKKTWKCGDIKIEFSEPRIEQTTGKLFLSRDEDFMYYYYTVKVFKKKEKKNKTKWKELWTVFVYDAPQITMLPKIIDEITKDDFTTGGWQQSEHVFNDKKYMYYTKNFDTLGLFTEDYYSVSRSVFVCNENIEQDTYSISFGMSDDMSCGSVKSIVVGRVNKKDILKLKNTAEEFIHESIEDFNDHLQSRIKLHTRKLRAFDNKLYVYREGGPEAIEDIYVPGDVMESINIVYDDSENADIIHHLVDKCEPGSGKILELKDCKLEGTEDGSIIVSGGYFILYGNVVRITEPAKIPLDLIVYEWRDISDNSNELSYTKEECLDTFEKLLTDGDKNEFMHGDLKDIQSLYSPAVVNRFWLCRPEHGIADAYGASDWIVKKIWKNINKNHKK